MEHNTVRTLRPLENLIYAWGQKKQAVFFVAVFHQSSPEEGDSLQADFSITFRQMLQVQQQ